MLLVVDVGNTQTHFGAFQGEELLEHWRFATVRQSTADQLGAALRNLLELRGYGFKDVEASIVSSTVPQLEPEWTTMASRYLGQEMHAVGPGTKTGMAIRYDNPREIGADRLVNAVAIRERFGGSAVCVDFGTATTFDVVSSDGEYVGDRGDGRVGSWTGLTAPSWPPLARSGAPGCRRSISHRPRA